MAKAKDMRDVPVTWETRNDTRTVLIPIINDVLGVEFDIEDYYPQHSGVSLESYPKYRSGGDFWDRRNNSHYWQGTAIKLYFKDWQSRTVHRTILIKPGENLDADKLRKKWAEILELKAQDDEARERQSAAKQSEAEKIAALRHELQLLGISTGSSQPFIGSIYVHSDGVKLEARRLTAAQVKAIVDILGE